ncbi:LytTR family DNA-binding domain-containing protein [Tenacibaculum finnmarkense]|uniref:LytR/AlgR family response regulator transcription factor n=1 Tax=Tenacibaculum finnmarkense TaxID=2781243 RepID=UPI001EFA8B6A|nr:LytTR family transcriptional regulator DNA-binding domain-containing protein [Tenacibaculum finnmarkense]MCG8251346.1 LytTR family transcriptional regulator DNA-binding domain-containing protein [Tenacibaculum finnmarkense genomovar finnmarkense]MCG8816020.1 response regulator [Tenacibaculum finnmarkense]MCG8819899.1 response regulator [Tenacibaculum finnmarkense]
MQKSVLIIDSDQQAINNLKELLTEFDFLKVIDQCATAIEAIDKINTLKPDIVYLDTQLNNSSGFDVIDNITLSEKPVFIFTSSSNKDALKAFDYAAFDYLLKPLNKARFFNSIDKLIARKKIENRFSLKSNLNDILDFMKENSEEKTKINTTVKGTKINIKSGNKVILLERNMIKYISASGYYIEIFTTDNRKFLLQESLSSIIKRLNASNFIRIHRSTIINTNFIDEIIASNYGETDVKINDNKTFRISKSYKKEFQEVIGF